MQGQIQIAVQATDGSNLMVIQATGQVVENAGWHQWLYRRFGPNGESHQTLPRLGVPYYAWANRGANPMRVWMPRA